MGNNCCTWKHVDDTAEMTKENAKELNKIPPLHLVKGESEELFKKKQMSQSELDALPLNTPGFFDPKSLPKREVKSLRLPLPTHEHKPSDPSIRLDTVQAESIIQMDREASNDNMKRIDGNKSNGGTVTGNEIIAGTEYANSVESIDKYEKLKENEHLDPVPEFSSSINQTMKSTYNNRGPFVFRLADYPGKDNPVELMKAGEGEIYYGQVKKKANGEVVREGRGYSLQKDAILYVGYFVDGMFHGPAVMVLRDCTYFRGIWAKGVLSGIGKCIWPDGRTYKGNWVKNLQEGYGEEYWDDGKSYYKGSFKGGRREGTGQLYLFSEAIKYEGSFVNNMFNGLGTFTWGDGKKYIGEFKNDLMHGRGDFTWPDGRKYSGDYKSGKKDGHGVFTWTDGRRYEGGWRRGLQSGPGVMIEANGKKATGYWSEGVRCNNIGGSASMPISKTSTFIFDQR